MSLGNREGKTCEETEPEELPEEVNGSDFHNMQQTLGKAFGETYISLDMLSFQTYTQKRK